MHRLLAALAFAVSAAALVGAALSDLVRYEIPNAASLALVLGFALIVPVMPFASGLSHGTAGLAMLAATGLLFALGLMGGGDAKLLAAAALWMGWERLIAFLLLTTVFGGGIGLVLILARRFAPDPVPSGRWFSRVLAKDEGIPYGLAIAAAALVLMARGAPDLLR
jgi:prepilin peptidase CpaA